MHGELDKSKNKTPRDADFVRAPTGSLHKSYVRVCNVLYIGNAQTTQKQHSHNGRGA